jgi:Na+-transporting NADH:ubiquinone oxidoreductase subunit F
MTGLHLIISGVVLFTLIIITLVLIILFAKSRLVPRGNVKLHINDDPNLTMTVSMGGKLLNALGERRIYLASACGGSGTCGQCKVSVLEGGGDVLPTEKTLLSRKQMRTNCRLACQVAVKSDMKLAVPPEVFETKKWVCTVRSNRNVSSFIKETVLELPEGEEVHFRSGGYVQLEAPPHEVHYRNFTIEEEYRPEWDKYNLWKYVSTVEEPVMRVYSMVNYPGETDRIILNVKIALPPMYEPDTPPGKMSSYIFSLKPGDRITITGPYGEFFAQDTDNEMIFVGGGAGMAPLRSIIFDQLKRVGSKRRISFWYGARNLREAFYVDDFNELAREHNNFQWHMALSRPHFMKKWEGYTGYVQHCLHDLYLNNHPSPEDCEYYICGPPVLVASVIQYLDGMGVEPESIYYDDFGEQ